MSQSDVHRNAIACVFLLLACGRSLAADWPAYRHDVHRTAATDEKLAFPLQLAWRYTCARPPVPAWPEQLGILNRMDFDYAAPLAVADGLVYFGSSADDTVRALDARTGIERWRFTMGGPVRFAPQFAGRRVYLGSDDGIVYCLDARSGKAVWTFRAALGSQQMLVNGRMASRWPLRCGVLVHDGVVYCVGGMLSTEGVFVYALQADTGKVLWCNDTLNSSGLALSDYRYVEADAKFQGDYSGSGSNPQGALLLGEDVLLIPNGYAAPTPLDCRTGRPIFWEPGGALGSGGTWMTIDRNRLYVFAKHGLAGNRLSLQDFILPNGVAGGGFNVAKIPQLAMYPQLRPGEVHSACKVSAIVKDGQLYAREAFGAALAGDTLLLGHDGAVTAERAAERPTAEVRFALAGGDLALHATVADTRVTRTAAPWDGSCVEVFGSASGKSPIGHVLLVPAAGTEPACAYRVDAGKLIPSPEIRVQTTATSEGYETSALIPVAMLALTGGGASCRLEVQLAVGGIDGTLRRGTLFGSARPREDAQRFQPFAFKASPAMASADAVRNGLRFAKVSPLTIRGAGAFWRGTVDGEARELAVADGRLFVSTRSGGIYCFGPADGDPKPVQSTQKATPSGQKEALSSENTSPSVDDTQRSTINALRAAGMDRGYALVFGDDDGRSSAALAMETRLHVICAVKTGQAADAIRARLLDTTALYGTRIHVLAVDDAAALPFPQWFANAIIVAGAVPGLDAAELYRVLRPCGGVLICPGLKRAVAEALVKQCDELDRLQGPSRSSRNGSTFFVRGKLSGALDWDSEPNALAADRLVRWPLRAQWIGGPSTRQIRKYLRVYDPGAPGPYLGNGRYVIAGERALTGVDAYNGAVLWSRPIPQAGAAMRLFDGLIYGVSEANAFAKNGLARDLWVNDDCVILQLGKDCLRGAGEAKIKLDARTGEQLAFYGPYTPPTPVNLQAPRTWTLDVDAAHAGTVTMAATATGLVLTLTTRDPVVTPVDSWELCFDFRPPAKRYGLYERGAFHAVVTVPQPGAAPRWTPGSGPVHPQAEIEGEVMAGGTRTIVTLPWAELEKLTGTRPESFDFAATLNSRDDRPDEPITRRHLFGDWTSDTINNGWATVAIDAPVAAVGAKIPAIVAGPLEALTDRADRVAGGRSLAPAVWQAPREHPLSGELGPKVYRAPTSCGGAFFSDTLISGRAGIDDFVDDSGMRLVAGVKARCTSPEVIGNGLLLISEESGFCSCNWPLRTSMALAPTKERSHEDWAIFHDRDVDTRVRHAFINLGAPGDRRDAEGHLWLGYPRPPRMARNYSLSAAGTASATTPKGVWMRFWPAAMQVPLQVETFGDGGAYRPEDDFQTYTNYMQLMTYWVPNLRQNSLGPLRVNADRVAIAGTDRPWIYASYYLGIRRATMTMDFIKPLAAAEITAPPSLDGKLEDPAWAGGPSAELPFTRTTVVLRYDAGNLYIAARRPPLVNRLGAAIPWAAACAGADAPVWDDDSFEVFLGDLAHTVHLGVSASGASYEALVAGTNPEDRAWNGSWRSAVSADANGLAFEMAIPWKTLAEAGIDKTNLGLNMQMNQKDVSGEAANYRGGLGRSNSPRETSGEALYALGLQGRAHCDHFAPLGLGMAPPVAKRSFTVRLHFCELDENATPGRRVSDVKLQGQTVLKDFDIVKEAGAPRTAIVKEFKGVKASDAMTLEFVPVGKDITPATAPIISAIEMMEEGFVLPSTAKH